MSGGRLIRGSLRALAFVERLRPEAAARLGGRLLARVERLRPGAVGRLGGRLLARVDRLGRPATRRHLGMGALSPVLVVVALVAVLAGLEVSVAAVAGVAGGVRAVADHLSPAAAPVASHGTVTVTAEIQTGAMDGRPGWPRLAPADLTFHAGQTVVLRIVSHDDGVAPLLGAQTEFGSVQGTVGGTELVDGKPLRSMPPEDVAHTFTVVALGLNLPIPAAPTGGSVTVVARFVPTRTGTFLWQCYAPCGSGAGSVGGAMSTNGWMAGKVRVIA